MKKFLKFLDNISEWTGKIFCWTVVILTLLVVIEVIMRYCFNRPTLCNFEITVQLYAFHFMIVAAYTLLHGSHVSVDIIYSKFSKKSQAILDIISYLIFFFPFCMVILWKGIMLAARSWSLLETSWSACASPIYPIKTVIPLTAILLILQGLAIFIKKLHMVIKEEEI